MDKVSILVIILLGGSGETATTQTQQYSTIERCQQVATEVAQLSLAAVPQAKAVVAYCLEPFEGVELDDGPTS